MDLDLLNYWRTLNYLGFTSFTAADSVLFVYDVSVFLRAFHKQRFGHDDGMTEMFLDVYQRGDVYWPSSGGKALRYDTHKEIISHHLNRLFEQHDKQIRKVGYQIYLDTDALSQLDLNKALLCDWSRIGRLILRYTIVEIREVTKVISWAPPRGLTINSFALLRKAVPFESRGPGIEITCTGAVFSIRKLIYDESDFTRFSVELHHQIGLLMMCRGRSIQQHINVHIQLSSILQTRDEVDWIFRPRW